VVARGWQAEAANVLKKHPNRSGQKREGH